MGKVLQGVHSVVQWVKNPTVEDRVAVEVEVLSTAQHSG